MTSTTGRFDLTRWDEEVIDEAEGAKLVRVPRGSTPTRSTTSCPDAHQARKGTGSPSASTISGGISCFPEPSVATTT
jgi:hypothetical protein